MAAFPHGSHRSDEPHEGEVKLSFKDRHYKEVSREKAEVVRVEYYDKGALKWGGHAVVYTQEPQMGYTSGSRDCVMLNVRLTAARGRVGMGQFMCTLTKIIKS